MSPSDSQDFDLLLLTNDAVEKSIKELEPGQLISFKGVLKFIGNEDYPHVIDTAEIGRPTKSISLEEVKKLPQYEFKKTGRLFGGNKL